MLMVETKCSGVVAPSANSNVNMKLGGLGMRLFGVDFAEHDRPPASEQLAQVWPGG